jgi:hypothetical protein
MSKKKLENEFENQLKMLGIKFEKEVRAFNRVLGGGKGIRARLAEEGLKDYRFDFYIIELELFIEIQGGIWLSNSGKKSAHSTGTGQERDMDKAFMAFRYGWNVLPINGKQIKSAEISLFLKEAIDNDSFRSRGNFYS